MLRTRDLYNAGILAVCQTLHEDSTTGGVGEPLRPGDREHMRSYLARRLAGWHEGPRRSKSYDDAVRQLVICALREGRKVGDPEADR